MPVKSTARCYGVCHQLSSVGPGQHVLLIYNFENGIYDVIDHMTYVQFPAKYAKVRKNYLTRTANETRLQNERTNYPSAILVVIYQAQLLEKSFLM